MILPSAHYWSCHSLPRKAGFTTPFQLLLEQRKISKGKCQYMEPLEYKYHKMFRAFAYNRKNNTSRHTSKKPAALGEYSSEQHLDSSILKYNRLNELFYALYEFSRPYTMIGTVISVASLSFLPLKSLAEVSPAFILEVLKAVIPFLFSQLYVSGINQVYDVEIDKINKPYLPLASGIFSMGVGIGISLMSLLVCIGLPIMYRSPPLLCGTLLICLSGSVYSIELPFMRWKRYPFLATTCIIVIRAIAVPFATFVHFQKCVLGSPILLTKSIIFTSCFAFLFSIVVALAKDIPDIEGDRKFGLKSLLAVKLGQDRVFMICISTLMVIYGYAIGIGASSSFLVSKIVTVLGHVSLASIVLHRALSIDLSVEGEAFDFYMFVWKLMYAEYLLIPFVR